MVVSSSSSSTSGNEAYDKQVNVQQFRNPERIDPVWNETKICKKKISLVGDMYFELNIKKYLTRLVDKSCLNAAYW